MDCYPHNTRSQGPLRSGTIPSPYGEIIMQKKEIMQFHQKLSELKELIKKQTGNASFNMKMPFSFSSNSA